MYLYLLWYAWGDAKALEKQLKFPILPGGQQAAGLGQLFYIMEWIGVLSALFLWQCKFADSAHLHLEYLNKCTFHLVHFYDEALSEGVLASNQYQQPWTVYNISRPARG